MRLYRVTGKPVQVGNCTIALKKEAAAARAHKLTLIEEFGGGAIYQLNGITSFKAGEEFGLAEEASKHIRGNLELIAGGDSEGDGQGGAGGGAGEGGGEGTGGGAAGGGNTPPVPSDGLEEKTVRELTAKAEELEIVFEGKKKPLKPDIIAAIREKLAKVAETQA